MNTKTRKLLAQSLLLPRKDRKQLVEALDASIPDTPINLSDQDFSKLTAELDELCEEADRRGRRRRNDWDVPELWRSRYYLRHGYHLDPKANSRRDHWQGGQAKHKNAVCPSCREPLRLMWDIDCNDSRFRKESPLVFGKLDRLPLYYCLHCPYPTIYRCGRSRRLQTIAADWAGSDESPFTDIPDAFPRKRIVFKEIPPEIENLLLVCQFLDEEWLRASHRRQLAEYLGARSTRSIHFDIRRSQLGGLPALQQGNPEFTCPYDNCPTHTWGHPILRNRRLYQMKLLATIDNDAGFEMKTEAAQIVFHICWACQTIHGDFQID